MARRRRGRKPADAYQVAAKKLKKIKKHVDAIVKLSEDMVSGVQDTVIRSVLEKIALFEKRVPEIFGHSSPLLDRGAKLLNQVSRQARELEEKAVEKVRGARRRRRRSTKPRPEAAPGPEEQPAA